MLAMQFAQVPQHVGRADVALVDHEVRSQRKCPK
jgi:hypothetical protein